MIRIFLSLIGVGVVLAIAPFAYVIAGFDGSAVLPADCAIVFGAAVHAHRDEEGNVVGNDPGPGINRRVKTAAKLYREGQVKRLVLSGGLGEGNRQSEAQVMKRVALNEGIPPNDIVIEDQSRSTEENLIYTRPLIADCDSVVGVSDRYHLARIEYTAWLQDWDLPTSPAEGRTNVLFTARSVLREALAIIYLTVNSLLT